jgi:hypothetical protein
MAGLLFVMMDANVTNMTTATLQTNANTQAEQTVRNVVQSAIKLKATTAAVCGSALKRWSIVWSN